MEEIALKRGRGRPPIAAERLQRHRQLRTTDSVWEEVQRRATEAGTTPQEWARAVIEAACNAD